jgi:hypothetical protein
MVPNCDRSNGGLYSPPDGRAGCGCRCASRGSSGPCTGTCTGHVSNILPLRLSVCPEVSLSKFIGSVAERVLEILAHQRYRAENLRRDLGLSGNIGTAFGPIINVMSFRYDLHFAGYRSTTHNISLGLLGDLSIIV